MQTKRLPILIGSAVLLAIAASAQAQDSSTHFTASDGTQVTVTSHQPPADHYGPAPTFAQLDTDHSGFITREEAKAYPPLLNDFDYIAHHANRISKAQFERWNQTQNR